MLTKVLSTSIIAGLFLIGCGETVTESKISQEQIENMPHQVDIKPKTSREFDPAGEEYLNFMKGYNLNSRIFRIQNEHTFLNDFEGRNQNLNYVFYYDTDHDKSTGYYNKWVPNAGADLLYENGVMYEYTGTPGSHEWSWKVKENYINLKSHPNHRSILNALSYGVTLNPDWTQHKFLGYYDTSKHNYENSCYTDNSRDRVFTTAKDNDTIYIHSYRKDKKKIDTNEKYYNYTFTINNTTYQTQGNILFNEAGEVIADNLLYEVREYDTVTLIPKRLLLDGNVKVKSTDIRDANWNEVTETYKFIDINFFKKDIQQRMYQGEHYYISLLNIYITESQILFFWRSAEDVKYANLSVYSRDGENINFDKHVLYKDNIGENKIPDYYWGVESGYITKLHNGFLIAVSFNVRGGSSMHFLIDQNNNFVSYIGDHYIIKDNFLIIYGRSTIKIIDTETYQTVFDKKFNEIPVRPARAESSAKITDNQTLVVRTGYYNQDNPKIIQNIFDIQDITDVKLLSTEELPIAVN